MNTFTLNVAPVSTQFGSRIGRTRKGRAIIFSSPRKIRYQRAIHEAALPFRPKTPHVGPIRVDFTFILPRPKSLCRARDPEGLIPCPVRPDRDNLQKGTQDGMAKAGFWNDDAQICDGRTAKFYAEKGGSPRIIVTISEVTE